MADGVALAAMSLQADMEADSSLPFFLALGVAYGQEVNGEIYSLQNGAYNALQLVRVDIV